MKRRLFCLHLLLWGATSFPLFASSWEESFVGHSRSAHMDALGRESPDDFFSVVGNPAWYSENSGAGVTLAYQNAWMGSKVSESNTLGFLGLVLQRNFSSLKIGFASLVPLGESLLLDTGNVSGRVAPWNARARHVQLQPSVAWAFADTGLSLGVVVPVSFHTKAEAELNFNSSESNSRFKAGLDPSYAYGVGLWWLEQDHKAVSVSAFYRDSQGSKADIDTQTSVPLPGGLNVDIDGSGWSTYLYEPERFVLQNDWLVGTSVHLGWMLRYSRWSKMPSPYLNLSFERPSIESPDNPAFVTKDTLEWGLGIRWQASPGHRFIGGYRYQPTPFKLAVHYYDSDQHQLGVGYTWVPLGSQYQFHFGGRLQFLEAGGLYTYLGLGVGYTM